MTNIPRSHWDSPKEGCYQKRVCTLHLRAAIKANAPGANLSLHKERDAYFPLGVFNLKRPRQNMLQLVSKLSASEGDSTFSSVGLFQRSWVFVHT